MKRLHLLPIFIGAICSIHSYGEFLVDDVLVQSKERTLSCISYVPNIGKVKKNEDLEIYNDYKIEKNKLLKLRKYIEKNFDYVGKDFSKKVREVYYDKKDKKAIYGSTTPEERAELAEEGIDLVSIPWVEKDN